MDGDWSRAEVEVTQQDGTACVVVTGSGDLEAGHRAGLPVPVAGHDARGWPDVGLRDPVIADAQAQLPGLRPCGFHSPYEAAAWSVLSQRIRILHAARLRDDLVSRHGDDGITDDSAGLFDDGMIGSVGTPTGYAALGPRELFATDLGMGTMGAGDISLAAGAVGPDVVGVAYRSRVHGVVTATVEGGRFALWFPGDELKDRPSGGVEVDVTYRDGQTDTSRLIL
ncbi:MAG: hypothetical protein ACR2K2_04360 [Mycobacteriales bacterium]